MAITQDSLVLKRKNKISTVRACEIDMCCNFQIQIICSKHDNKWYLRHSKHSMRACHSGHLPVDNDHVDLSICHVNSKVENYIRSLLNEKVPATTVSALVFNNFKITLSSKSIFKLSQKILLEAICLCPHGSPVDILIADFKQRPDVSFIYVTHDIQSGFVTHQNRNDSDVCLDSSNCYISVYENDIAAWRLSLKVKDSTTLLVAFAWCDDEQLRLGRMFPEFLACDTTFGVTKEQRNLFLFAGIDGNNKTFTLMHCFMPSKEMRAYNWAIRVAFPQLVTTATLRFNQCISSDGEIGIYQPLQSMMSYVDYMNNASHRLDKYHLFSKPWKEKVTLKLGEDDAIKSKLKYLYSKMSTIFNYVESRKEMTKTIDDYKAYYYSIKSSLKSETLCESIESIDTAMINSLQYIAHYHFIDVTTFEFLGDSIVEGANSSVKNAKLPIHVNTNMTINTSASTQLKISSNQNNKRKR